MASRHFTRRLSFGAVCALACLASACADEFNVTRSPEPRGTVGEELYGVLCDRIGGQALHEDLTGSSYRSICHKDASGAYGDKVDPGLLPPSDPSARDTDGNPVSVKQQEDNRAHAVARVEAFGRRRPDMIAALDATFPEQQIPIKDVANGDPAKSCGSAGQGKLSDQLADMLGRFQNLYNDGTLPQSTESLARVFNAIKASPEAQASFARFEARQGYRPIALGLGAARPVIAYPNLRDLANSSLALLSADSRPYDTSRLDDQGNRIPVPGPANAQLNQLVQVSHHELAYAKADVALLPLGAAPPDGTGRAVLSRPRSDLEMLENIFYAQGAAFGNAGSKPTFIARRDPFGYAQVHLINDQVPAPFVDMDGNKFADTDGLGRFITTSGEAPASPLLAVGQPFGTRDQCGRALRSGSAGDAGASPAPTSDGGSSGAAADPCGTAAPDAHLYDYVDTAHVFATSLMKDLKPLANPDPAAKHETLMYALAGAPILFGARDGGPKSKKCYSPDPAFPSDISKCKDQASIVAYDGYLTDTSALLDLVYAFGQMMGDPTMDDTLAYVSQLFQTSVGDLARIAGDGLAMKATASAHPEAKIPAKSTFWDEMIDVGVELQKEPGLLEDVLRSLGAEGSQNLGQIFANYMQFSDQITYDPAHLNGPPLNKTLGHPGDMSTPVDRAKPDTGFNRSAMFRFLSLIHDTNGVAACNAKDAVVHAVGIPLINTADVCSGGLCSLGSPKFAECTVFKIDDLATFYLDSIVGKAELKFRSKFLLSGIAGLGAATVALVEKSSAIGLDPTTPDGANATNDTYGFWDDPGTKTFRPRPQWLNRLVFFDQVKDTHAPTQNFLKDLNGPHIGTSVCPERVLDPDPCVGSNDCNGANLSPDNKVHGLRNCPDGDWLDQRGADTIFVWEQFGFYKAITPLLSAFVNHQREDLFVKIMETLYRHWGDNLGTDKECLLSSDPNAKFKTCSKDGLVTYEPLLVEDFQGDILLALHDLEKTLVAKPIPHCSAIDPKTHACTSPLTSVDGISVLASATRALLDPDQAKAVGLKDRHGLVTSLRNDGQTNPQVTPIYLLTQALNAMDQAFANSTDTSEDRLGQWRTARSQLVDQFLKVDGTATASTFSNSAIPQVLPTIIDALRAQLLARCPTTGVAPFDRCAWARDDLTNEMATVMHGPTFAATMDVLDAIRKDPAARQQMGLLLQYLLDSGSQNDALPNVLASANDLIQLLKDDTNLVPFYNALASGLEPTTTDTSGHILQKSVVDAQLALLARVSGRATDATGNEICVNEVDPNQVLTIALKNVVTPMAGANGTTGQTPLQVIMDVIGDVNRADPSLQTKFAAEDYASISDNVSDFMLNRERGLEQFYEIVRQGTVH